MIDDSEFILVNLYNANTESEQINPFIELNTLLSNLDLSSEKQIIFAGDFNLFFDHSLDAKGGSPNLKKNILQVNYLKLKKKKKQIYVIYGE